MPEGKLASSKTTEVCMTHPARQALVDKAMADRKRVRKWLLPHANFDADRLGLGGFQTVRPLAMRIDRLTEVLLTQ